MARSAACARPLLLITREQGVPDQIDGSHRFSLDNLFVTRSAVPVLVEVKRATDTRLRREVVGQLLDYAANGTAYWSPGSLEAEFRKQAGEAADETLREFLSDDDLADGGADFWQQVDANLEAGRVRLVVAADVIPRELARVVEFLNEQMRATVLAVELTYYEDEGGLRTLVPKVIGETERAQAGKPAKTAVPTTILEWVEMVRTKYPDSSTEHLDAFISAVESRGGQARVTTTGGSICAAFRNREGRELYPFIFYSDSGGGRVYVYFQHLKNHEPFSEDLRVELFRRFRTATKLRGTNIGGQPSFAASELGRPELGAAIDTLLEHLRAPA